MFLYISSAIASSVVEWMICSSLSHLTSLFSRIAMAAFVIASSKGLRDSDFANQVFVDIYT